jgi:hypothetical protein
MMFVSTDVIYARASSFDSRSRQCSGATYCSTARRTTSETLQSLAAATRRISRYSGSGICTWVLIMALIIQRCISDGNVQGHAAGSM